MDGLRLLLIELKQSGRAKGNFRGLLHVLIGRSIHKADGTLISKGITWRALADLLYKIRWDGKTVDELGIDPAQLSPKDRERYWFQTICLAELNSSQSAQAGDRMVEMLKKMGYVVAPEKSQGQSG